MRALLMASLLLAGCASPSVGQEPVTSVLRDRSVLVYEMYENGTATGHTMRYAFSPDTVIDPLGRAVQGFVLEMETSLEDPVRQLAAERMWIDACRTPIAFSFEATGMEYLDMPSDFAKILQPFLASGIRDAPSIEEIERRLEGDRGADDYWERYYDAWLVVPGQGYDMRMARDDGALVGAIGYKEDRGAWTTWSPGMTWFDDAPVPSWFSIGGPQGGTDWRLVEHQEDGEPLPDCGRFSTFDPVYDLLPAGRHATADSPGIEPPLAWVHDRIKSGLVPQASIYLEQHPDAYIDSWRFETFRGAFLNEQIESDASWTVRYVHPGANDYMAVHCSVHEEWQQEETMRCTTSSYDGYSFARDVDLDDFDVVNSAHWVRLCEDLDQQLVSLDTWLSFYAGERSTRVAIECDQAEFWADGESARLLLLW